MSVSVRIPTILRTYTGGDSEVSAEGANLAEVLDDLDAKFEMYARCLTKDTTDGPFTERDPVLGRPLLKQRSV